MIKSSSEAQLFEVFVIISSISLLKTSLLTHHPRFSLPLLELSPAYKTFSTNLAAGCVNEN